MGVQTNLDRAQERRADVLCSKTIKAAVASSRVRNAQQTRDAHRATMKENRDHQHMKASKARADALVAKANRAAAANAKVAEVQEIRSARNDALQQNVQQSQMKAANLRASRLHQKQIKLGEHQRKVEENCSRVHAARVIQCAWRTRALNMYNTVKV